MNKCDTKIIVNPIYNRRGRKSRIIIIIITRIFNISISVKRGRGRFKKFII